MQCAVWLMDRLEMIDWKVGLATGRADDSIVMVAI
jgi:hypothetical protein